MAIIAPTVAKRRRPVPVSVKLLLLIAVVVGISIRGCYRKQEKRIVQFHSPEIVEVSSNTVEILISIKNTTPRNLEKPLYIIINSNMREKVCSRITSKRLIKANTDKRYRFVLTLEHPLFKEEKLHPPLVEIFQPSIF
ncbi:MAG: hypothetical protein K8S56_06240 [Candidatus Cloacimonetes bacterium]|nr:hypothetical protein [Candidatus Cloacimonadota bacterium]